MLNLMLIGNANAGRRPARWITRHENLHRERSVMVLNADTRLDQRILTLEGESRKIENLAYRMTVAEQSNLNTSKSIERLTDTVNNQSTDIRVMREIIEGRFGKRSKM